MAKGCTSCKKKKPITLGFEVEEIIYIPSADEVKLAYVELGNKDQSKREFINKVYKSIFNEDFNFDCPSCVNTQVRKFQHYITNELNMNI